MVVLSLFLASYSDAQAPIPISDIPSSSCFGNPAGTVTFASDITIPTGEVQIPASDIWNQTGAVWEFSPDSEGFVFEAPGIPGYGAGSGSGGVPDAAESAFKLSNDKSTLSIIIPTSTLGGEWEVLWAVVPSSVANSPVPGSPATLGATWAADACSLS